MPYKFRMFLSFIAMALGLVIALVAGHAILTFPPSFYTNSGSTVGAAVGRFYVYYLLLGGSLLCSGVATISR